MRVPADILPVWVGFALLVIFAVLAALVSVWCAVLFVASLVNGERR